MEFIEFVPKQTPRDLWESFHAFRRRRHKEASPYDPYDPDDVTEADMCLETALDETKRFVAIDQGGVVGYQRVHHVAPTNPSYPEQRDFAGLWIELLPECRRKGIARSWMRQALPHLENWETKIVNLWSHEKDGWAFLDALGAERRYSEAANHLDLPKVDWAMVEQWAQAPDGIVVQHFPDRLPDDILEEYSPVYAEISNSMPREELAMGDDIFTPETWTETYKWVDAIDGHHHTVLTRQPSGEISALTDVLRVPGQSEFVHQWATGVRIPYRGLGLGKLVKARMLLYIRERHPEVRWIVTENAGSNEPMLHINHKLGFTKYKETIGYQIDFDKLKKALGD